MIIVPGKYRTRGGHIVFIARLEASPNKDFPARGKMTDSMHADGWTIEGKYFHGPAESNFDLVERIPNDTPDPDGEAYVLALLRAAIAEVPRQRGNGSGRWRAEDLAEGQERQENGR